MKSFSKQIGWVLAQECVRLVVEDVTPERKAFHDVLHGAGYTHDRSSSNFDLFTHPTKPKVGVLHGKVIGTSALSNGHKLDTPAKLKDHLTKK